MAGGSAARTHLCGVGIRGAGDSLWLRMVVGAALAAAATGAHLALHTLVGSYHAPFLVFFPFVYFATRWGRRVGGWSCALLSLVFMVTVIFPPPWVPPPALASAIAFLVAAGTIIHATSELMRALVARDDLVAIASHDLRAPLGVLRLRMALLTRRIRAGRQPTAEEIASTVEFSQRQIDRMLSLINNLLDLSRLRAHRFRVERRPSDLSALVREAAERHRVELQEAHCRVLLHGTEMPQPGVWDPDRLEQAITNLLTNALKHGAGRPIELAVGGDDACAWVTVRDHGAGMSAEKARRLFRRWGGTSGERAYASHGLGLWIVHAVVTAHGGRVNVTSAPGDGSTFRLELPRAPASVRKARSAARADAREIAGGEVPKVTGPRSHAAPSSSREVRGNGA